jgi:hypothetical protein
MAELEVAVDAPAPDRSIALDGAGVVECGADVDHVGEPRDRGRRGTASAVCGANLGTSDAPVTELSERVAAPAIGRASMEDHAGVMFAADDLGYFIAAVTARAGEVRATSMAAGPTVTGICLRIIADTIVRRGVPGRASVAFDAAAP